MAGFFQDNTVVGDGSLLLDLLAFLQPLNWDDFPFLLDANCNR